MRVNLHIYQSPFTHESRILKISETMRDMDAFDKIYIFAMWKEGLAERQILDERREVWRFRSWLIPSRWRGRLWNLLRRLEWLVHVGVRASRLSLTCINAHSLLVLPLSVLLKWLKCCKLVYDTHELETETQAISGLIKQLARYIERLCIASVDAIIVVSDSIGHWYSTAYPLSRVYVVRNVPRWHAPAANTNNVLRRAFSIRNSDLLFLYQGGLGHGRGIELVLKAFSCVPSDRHVIFMGSGPLEELVRNSGRPNIHLHPPVPPDCLLSYSACADVGLLLYENTCLNHYYCLPNKLFEYLMASTPVIVSDFPELARVARRYDAGWIIPCSHDILVALITRLTMEEVTVRKDHARRTAVDYRWENEVPTLLSVYEHIGIRHNISLPVGSRDVQSNNCSAT